VICHSWEKIWWHHCAWTVRNFPVVTRLDVMYDLTGPIRFKNWS